MALSVVWAATAQQERKEILRSSRERNGNSQYSRELARHFDANMNLVAEQELIGKATDWEGVRCPVPVRA
jgi:hypothetical protein